MGPQPQGLFVSPQLLPGGALGFHTHRGRSRINSSVTDPACCPSVTLVPSCLPSSFFSTDDLASLFKSQQLLVSLHCCPVPGSQGWVLGGHRRRKGENAERRECRDFQESNNPGRRWSVFSSSLLS